MLVGFESARYVVLTLTMELAEYSSIFTGGRPDVMKLVKETYTSWNAEVVFITSNYQGNTEIMEGCKEAGIPAFVRLMKSDCHGHDSPNLLSQGTLWDF